LVSDIRPYLWTAGVCIAPLLSGSGTRLKILEALAAGCPVVSTSIGAEGLDLIDGQDLLLGDDPEAFAQQVAQVIENPSRALTISEKGKQIVKSLYDWRVIAPKLEFAYEMLLKKY
jgi:glycosyltransferase involved in cell wall biosynthesis